MTFKTNQTIASFGGKLLKLSHDSAATSCSMALNLFLPPQARTQKVPVLFYLSGLYEFSSISEQSQALFISSLFVVHCKFFGADSHSPRTCTGDNCAEKGFAQPAAARHGIAIVYPDTSPRGLKVPGEDDSYDFGAGAGFYVDATREPWSKGYRMYSYIVDELPKALFAEFKELDGERVSIFGHSMGGHGALTLFLKNPGRYRSVSAFAPICNPTQCPWGEKAFKGYFGEDAQDKWREHDATELVKKAKGPLDILIDVGTDDNFYKQGQLLPENFVVAAKEAGLEKGVKVRYNEGYDHSYYMISTFMGDHVDHAARHVLN